MLGQSGYFYGKNVKFTLNVGYLQAGVLYVSTSSYFDLVVSEFSYNQANETSTIYILGSSSTKNVTIDGCTFEYNTAIKNTLSFMYAQALVTSTDFDYNSATERTKNIFIGFSTIIMNKCTFKSTVNKNPAT